MEADLVISTIASLLYWLLLIDLTVFSMRFSTFLLVIGRVASELGLFLSALIYLIISFASAVSLWRHALGRIIALGDGMGDAPDLTLQARNQRGLRHDHY